MNAGLVTLLRSLRLAEHPDFLPVTAGDLTVDVVTDPAELRAAFAARFSAYVSCGFIDPTDYPWRIEFDDFDDVSIHFVAREVRTGALAGYTRLILDARSRLQADEILDISDYRARHPSTLCEMSRLIALPEGRRHASRAVRWAACRWAALHGIEQIVGVSLERDRVHFDRRRFLPMQPHRTCAYRGSRFAPLRGLTMYGNVFDVEENAEYVRALEAGILDGHGRC